MEESENGDEWDGVLRVTHLFRGSDEGPPGGRSGRGRNLEEILDGVALSLLSAGHIFTARNNYSLYQFCDLLRIPNKYFKVSKVLARNLETFPVSLAPANFFRRSCLPSRMSVLIIFIIVPKNLANFRTRKAIVRLCRARFNRCPERPDFRLESQQSWRSWSPGPPERERELWPAVRLPPADEREKERRRDAHDAPHVDTSQT
ncbi:hypothetical protein GEV33_005001 [Tenebrio molitor]|uniref:Uncharacterized protein n=1 Tax=Tenebrio molitor TaxID=7067 RepID=A0A8J6LE42_TENMO|nr:hypothetical protein GEV33_005001 [Tenebrio molitor]